MRKSVKSLGVAAAVAALLLGTGVGSASADGYGAVPGSNGTIVSMYVFGQSVNVTAIDAGVHYPGWGTICNATDRATGTRVSGAAWSKTWGTFSGCFPLTWSSQTTVNLDFKSGSVIRLRVTHDGYQNAGQPTVAIWA